MRFLSISSYFLYKKKAIEVVYRYMFANLSNAHFKGDTETFVLCAALLLVPRHESSSKHTNEHASYCHKCTADDINSSLYIYMVLPA